MRVERAGVAQVELPLPQRAQRPPKIGPGVIVRAEGPGVGRGAFGGAASARVDSRHQRGELVVDRAAVVVADRVRGQVVGDGESEMYALGREHERQEGGVGGGAELLLARELEELQMIGERRRRFGRVAGAARVAAAIAAGGGGRRVGWR